MEDKGLIDGILHYQQCLDKYARRNDEARVLYCLSKLYKMPINIQHLEKTGVGRTVNALRKLNGEIAEAAKTLVGKWKEMVAAVSEEHQANDVPKIDPIKKEEREVKEKLQSVRDMHGSSHKKRSQIETDLKSNSSKVKDELKRNKFNSTENEVIITTRKRDNSTTNSISEEEDSSLKKNKHVHDHKREYSKHKSKRKRHSSDESCDESDLLKRGSKERRGVEVPMSYTKLDIKQHDSDEDVSCKTKIGINADEKSLKFSSKRHSSEKEIVKNCKSQDGNSSRHRKTNSKRHSSDSEEDNVTNSKHKSRINRKDESSSIKHKNKKSNHSRDEDVNRKSKSSSHKKEDPSLTKHKTSHERNSDSEEELKCKVKNGFDSDENPKVDKKKKHKEEKREKTKEESKFKKSKGYVDKEDRSRHSNHKSEKKGHRKTNIEIGENGIGSGSGASFAEALGMLLPPSKTNKKKISLPMEKQPSPSDSSPDDTTALVPELLTKKKLTPLDVNVDDLLPEITPNYRPRGLPWNVNSKKILNDDETLGAIMYSKISRTKVYSGNKVTWGNVPSLFDICTRILQDNIDALEYTGGVPYLILKPVIERANPDQLFMLEHHNPYLIEDTDELWQLHCNKEFRSKKREEMETWRDMYMRCLDEREAKLKALTANIKQSQDKSIPVRQTKLAYVDSVVKPPRNIARKQAKLGTGGVDKKPAVTPSSRLTQLATSGAAGQVVVPNPGPRAASSTGTSTSTTIIKPKKAPLMQKTLALMKSRIFRR